MWSILPSGLVMSVVIASQAWAAETIVSSKGRAYHTGLIHPVGEASGLGKTHVMLADCENLPEEFDLRDFGVVPPVRDQGNCGSCWAFSVTASLESAHAGMTTNVLDLSEQQIVSCDNESFGCNGGWLNDFAYQIAKGQASEEAFPYRAADVTCRSGLTPIAKATGFMHVGQANRRATEKEVRCALFQSKTIPWITVSANSQWGNMPTDTNGLHTRCNSGQTNHAVGLIGWKTVDGKVYFKMRNSWGTEWGSSAGKEGAETGYAMMGLGCDNLGEEIAYIKTETMRCNVPAPQLPDQTRRVSGGLTRLAIPAEVGVDYEWYLDGAKIGDGNSAEVSAKDGAIVTVVAKNNYATSESSTKLSSF